MACVFLVAAANNYINVRKNYEDGMLIFTARTRLFFLVILVIFRWMERSKITWLYRHSIICSLFHSYTKQIAFVENNLTDRRVKRIFDILRFRASRHRIIGKIATDKHLLQVIDILDVFNHLENIFKCVEVGQWLKENSTVKDLDYVKFKTENLICLKVRFNWLNIKFDRPGTYSM